MFARVAAALSAVAVTIVTVAVPVVPAGASSTVSASTTVTNHDDSGWYGNWAKDNFTRAAGVTLMGLASSPDCAGLDPCYEYTASLLDRGSFTTDPGATPPNDASVTLPAVSFSGTFSGGQPVFTFYADTDQASADGVPVAVDGNGPVSPSRWLTLFFPDGTQFAVGGAVSTSLLPSWIWSYKASATCERWVHSYISTAGDTATDGNVAGVDQCRTPVVNQASLPIAYEADAMAADGDDDYFARLTASGNAPFTWKVVSGTLPTGLQLNSWNGIIWGTSTAPAGTYAFAVTATDESGQKTSAPVSFDITVQNPSELSASYACGGWRYRHWYIHNMEAGGRGRSVNVFAWSNYYGRYVWRKKIYVDWPMAVATRVGYTKSIKITYWDGYGHHKNAYAQFTGYVSCASQ